MLSMQQKLYFGLIIFSILFFIDQYIKILFVNGFSADGECISLVLAYNKGVAFSLFAFLGDNLKYIQIAMMSLLLLYLVFNKNVFSDYHIPFAILFAGAISNIYDRFFHEGVVDYIYWHCGFDFAIFNLADILINISIVLIVYTSYINDKKSKQEY